MIKISCPVCGGIDKNDVVLYDTKLRKQNIDISPVHPTCRRCNSPVVINNKCCGGELIILNGTCGSGKTTVTEELMKNHGYYAIDGDCVFQSVKHRLGIEKIEYNSDDVINEIAAEIDYISLYFY